MTKMGSPGVRIQLKDSSQYTVIENPNATAGVVGFAPKGELNKIITLKNTAAQDTTFGIGFNNSKYNQGMYAARAVINAGGYVEYIRPYGEEIDKTNAFKRDLKSDCFVVSFDKNAMNAQADDPRIKAEHDGTSITVSHYAATRYKTDGASDYGVTRKINNISETITEGSNVKFNVDAGDDYADSPVYKGDGDMVLFALINADPSAANRAISYYEVSYIDDMGDDNSRTFKVTLATAPQFIEGDTVYGPVDAAGNELVRYLVTNVNGKDVYLEERMLDGSEYEEGKPCKGDNGYKPSVLIFSDTENAVADGYDYVNVKTAVTGRGAKIFSTLHLTDKSIALLGGQTCKDENGADIDAKFYNGTLMTMRTSYQEDVYVRIANTKYPKLPGNIPWSISEPVNVEFSTEACAGFVVGDIVTIEWDIRDASTGKDVTHSAEYSVTGILENVVTFNFRSSTTLEADIEAVGFKEKTFTFKGLPTGWCSDIPYVTVALTKETTLDTFANDLVAVFRNSKMGYGSSVVVNDIVSMENSNDEIVVTNGSAFDYNVGDIVAITRGSFGTKVLPETTDDGEPMSAQVFSNENVFFISTVKSINGFNNTVVLDDVVPKSFTINLKDKDDTADVDEREVYQLLNLTATNKSTYGAINVTKIRKPDELANTVVSKVVVDENDTKIKDGVICYNVKEFYIQTTKDSDGVAEIGVGDTLVLSYTTGKDDTKKDYTHDVLVQKIIEDETTESTVTYKVGFRTTDYRFPSSRANAGNGNLSNTGNRVPAGPAMPINPSVLGTGKPTVDIFSIQKLTFEYSRVADIYLIGNYNIQVNAKSQENVMPIDVDDFLVSYASDAATTDAPFIFAKGNVVTGSIIVERSEKVLMDSNIGATFIGLGLANIKFEDVNFDGTSIKVYDLTDAGEEVARLFISCNYMFNGTLYEFEGTVVPYVYNDIQLYIGDAAESELVGSGVTFVLNDNGTLDMFLEDASYDLSETVRNFVPSASTTAISFNTEDPAVIHNAIWTYNPANNKSTSTLSTAYNLFLDKDNSDVTFIVAAGNGINNFGMKGLETLNTTVMNAVLNVCELRKDCFALFDGVSEAKVETALKKDILAGQFGSTLGRWGAIYDARPIFYDGLITKSNVEVAPSVAMASLITSNRAGGIWWYVPAGKDTGIVPSAWCTRIKNKRAFSYPEDPDSDIAKLCDIHVNPFRSNTDGLFVWGDFTMQMEDSAFNQIHVTMLMAGVHKMFYKYLDGRVFRLNTSVLRAQITSDLQAQLDIIKNSNPSGFYEATVICNDTNNTPDVIDQNKLYVDLKVKPTKSTRYIYLRSEVLATSSGTTVSATLT